MRAVIKCVVIPPDPKIEKNYLLDDLAYGGCARSAEREWNPSCSTDGLFLRS